jgi:hypothetical protein
MEDGFGWESVFSSKDSGEGNSSSLVPLEQHFPIAKKNIYI